MMTRRPYRLSLYSWSQLAEIQTPPFVTTDFLDLKLIGDSTFRRMILEKYKQTGFLKCRIGRIYSEGVKKKIRVLSRNSSANNHHARFGPGTANLFCNMINLRPMHWEQRSEKVTFGFL